ncbi:cytochrome C [bacterium endosymbiont of Escarpia laminata]|nr:MAG: cytochrome C [bacterium endosymbiont of Escarpia laminata]RLJ21421.1 MAG: cytochrome C [bacterium endosymbiont of Escarpia laminata]
MSVVYSAASNPLDPILSGINSAGSGPVSSSMLPDGSVFKTNFWDGAQTAYDAFYPSGILPAFYPPGANILDLGLPMPNVEQLYLGDGNLSADQQSMPGRHGPYTDNLTELFEAFVMDQPFFTNPAFKFGYVKEGVNWYEAPGIPMTAYDDYGRENPWPLLRVQAIDAAGTVLASNDTVVPISGEANCGICHNAPVDGGNGEATKNLVGEPSTVLDDPQLDAVPLDVSLEYAADLNLIRLHDQKHGTDLQNSTPVVCQTCHYTPALDLAQLGPLGPENDGPLVLNGVTISDSMANGRDQVKHKSMSNVMHSHHGSVTDDNGDKLFPDMPPAIKNDLGIVENFQQRRDVLEATCYQCHPGRRTDCLRGAMSNGGMLCQDCHGNMEQVGNDFTRGVSPATPGKFELGGDFYTNADQPRVPWANEPGCGSCHTGDAMDNLASSANTMVNNVDADANVDGIRLFQAYLTSDAKATPIVPTNKRFAENVIEANNPAVSGPADPRIGNPMLYRISTGHEGIFCEACHGATHGIWPNKNPDANDNVAAVQLQGHTGTVSECSTCHTGDLGNTLEGPHGMHPVGDTSFSNGGHEDLAEKKPDACRACHGVNGEGTVLARAATDRTLSNEGKSITLARGEPVTCTHCHENEL